MASILFFDSKEFKEGLRQRSEAAPVCDGRLGLAASPAARAPAHQAEGAPSCAVTQRGSCADARGHAQVCVLVLGLDGTGKTCCLQHFTTARDAADALASAAAEPGAPVGCVAHKLRVLTRDGTLRKLLAVDFAAAEQRRREALWRRYFPVTQAALWVLDASDRRRLQQAQDTLDRCVAPYRVVLVQGGIAPRLRPADCAGAPALRPAPSRTWTSRACRCAW